MSARSTRSAAATPWAVVLAGGEGTRLRPLIRRVLGDERPKQYVPLLGPRSLLRQTLDRVALRMPVSRTVVVTVRAHTGHIAQEFTGGAEPPYVLVQPSDRGTAAGILHAAHWIRRRDPEATIAFFPSDHFILGEATFMAHVADVVRAVQGHPDHIALLGAQPTSPEAEYGWISPARRSTGPTGCSAVRRFWEKPSEARAQLGLATGCLWNTAITVARAETLIELGALRPARDARSTRPGRCLRGLGRGARRAASGVCAAEPDELRARGARAPCGAPRGLGPAPGDLVRPRQPEPRARGARAHAGAPGVGRAPAWTEVPAGSDIIDQPAIPA